MMNGRLVGLAAPGACTCAVVAIPSLSSPLGSRSARTRHQTAIKITVIGKETERSPRAGRLLFGRAAQMKRPGNWAGSRGSLLRESAPQQGPQALRNRLVEHVVVESMQQLFAVVP